MTVGVLLLFALCLLLLGGVVAVNLGMLARVGAPIERLRAWGATRGVVRGDGVATALEVAGARGVRRFTVGYQALPGAPPVLLAAVDCASADPRVDDGVLAVRIAGAELRRFDARRLDALVDELCALAEELEAASPEAEGASAE